MTHGKQSDAQHFEKERKPRGGGLVFRAFGIAAALTMTFGMLLPTVASAAGNNVTGIAADCAGNASTAGGNILMLTCTIAVHEENGTTFAYYSGQTAYTEPEKGNITGPAAGLVKINGGYDAVPVCTGAVRTTEYGSSTLSKCLSFGLKNKPVSTVTATGQMPQSGDPAASWMQTAPYVVAALAVSGAAAAVMAGRRLRSAN